MKNNYTLILLIKAI